MASYIGASAEQEDADPILMAFAAEATKGDPASPEARAQAAAMLAGATQGWTSSAADPSRYNKRGRPIQSRRQDRGEAR